jgi:uncharacterized protein
MTNLEITERTIAFVKQQLQNAEGGHDWFHIERVYRNSMHIAQTEDSNLLVVSLAALLHETIGPKTARAFLESEDVESDTINHVVKIIENISYKGGNFKREFSSIELDIVQDADRLDAIGAIGIARAFNYGGFKNRALHDPEITPNLNMSKEEYKKSAAPTITHFYEKLLLLKDKMNTETGKKIAEQRHQYMESFLSQFYSEWNGEK